MFVLCVVVCSSLLLFVLAVAVFVVGCCLVLLFVVVAVDVDVFRNCGCCF